MPLRSYKPTSAGRRFMTRSTFEEITTDTPHKPLAQLDDFILAFGDGLNPNSVGCAAIVLAADDILRHIHQLAGHVSGVGRLERGVGQSFARAVSRDEVFQNGQTFAKV